MIIAVGQKIGIAAAHFVYLAVVYVPRMTAQNYFILKLIVPVRRYALTGEKSILADNRVAALKQTIRIHKHFIFHHFTLKIVDFLNYNTDY